MRALLMLPALLAAAAALSAPSSPSPSPAALPTWAPNRDNYIAVKGGQVQLVYLDSVRLSVRCGSGAAAARGLDDLPPAALSTRVRDLSVAECAPPAAADYAGVLARLGVGTLPDVTVRLALPATGAALTGASLAALRPVSLTLEPSGRVAPPAPRDLLRGLDALARLEVRRVPLAADALAQAPPSLRSLTLDGAGPTLVPAATLRSLRALAASAEVELEAGAEAPSLRVLSLRLRAEAAPPALSRFPLLETLAVTGWRVPEPAPWADCASLTTLTLTTPGFARLPERWTAACGALTTLELHTARSLASLPARLLEGACAAEPGGVPCPSPALTRLVLSYGALSSVPMTLFDPVPNLRYLDLKHNKLLTLPNAIFATLTALTNLTLAGNQFRDDVYSRLGTLRALRALDLSGNPDLGDACPGGRHLRSGESQLKDMKDLEALNLSRTSVTRICRDWRERMRRLVHLRLVSTKVAHLAFEDLQYVRDNRTVSLGARVVLLDSPVRRLDYRPEDEVLARAAPPAAVLVQLNLPLACDCESFRAVRALRAFPAHAALNAGELRCAGGGGGAEGPLVRVRLEDMLCASPGWCTSLPAGCACAAREQGAAGAQLRHVRVTCERAGLTAVPALPAPRGTAVEWDLRLAGNRIETLEGLPANLTALDVRESGVRRAAAGAAATLAAAARLRLAGNPLECGCEAAPLLEAVATLARRGAGALDAARCADGRDLAEAAAARAACPAPRTGWGAGALAALGCVLALLALAAASLGAALARPERRARVKGVLLRWGWLPRAAEPEEARPYDVFVSFAHADAAAARELAARLEAGAAPLRLCLHSRDWAPGEYIDAQIAASVRSARRTVALVSRAWLRSRWSRVELREALAGGGVGARGGGEGGARRLVLVLLEEARVLAPLDRELRRCMATCTYLQRDHPHFWERLREALPRPLPPAPPAPPDPPPAPGGPPEPAAAA